tara:strand:+ start:15978 stop:16469 length:492 start_codon:yes stop_codon:yes gene_type:complete
MLKDESMAEVVDEFCQESKDLLDTCEEILDEFEDEEDPALLEKFGQTIDRIMGAAKSLDAHTTGTLAELGKTIGYKSSQCEDKELLSVVGAALFDLVDVMKRLIQNISDSKEEKAQGLNIDALKTRFVWLADKFKNIQRSSVAVSDETQSQEDIDALLKNLGL